MFEEPTLALVPLVLAKGKALITWTPLTFYVAAGLVHTFVIWFGFKLMNTDPEHNTIGTALVAAGVGGVAAYLLRDYGLVGHLGVSAVFMGVLTATSGGDIMRAGVVFLLVMGAYSVVGNFVLSRTPLEAHDLQGVPQVVIDGKIDAEPVGKGKGDKYIVPGS